MSFQFSLNHWSKLDNKLDNKPNVLLSVLVLLTITVCFIRLISDILWGSYISAGILCGIIVLFFIIYRINESGRNKTAKILHLLFINTIIFIYCNLAPPSLGVYFYFFPLMGTTVLIFKNKERKISYLFYILPVLLIVIMSLYDFQIFGEINIHQGIEDTTTTIVNLVMSLLVLVFILLSMSKINKEIDQKKNVVSNQLREKNFELEKANEELIHFTYSTSHDLKAPLTSILGLINISKYEIKDKKALDYFSKIEKSVGKLTFFIKDIMDLSRNSHIELQKDQINFQQMLNEIIENNKYIEIARDIEFITNVNVKNSVISDRTRLEILLSNLISNAIKYQLPDESKKRVEINLETKENNLLISINDNGRGIPKAYQEKVYDMFYRGNEDSSGSGLGLYIVKDVIQKMKGTIDLKSEENKGTVVNISIPIQSTDV